MAATPAIGVRRGVAWPPLCVRGLAPVRINAYSDKRLHMSLRSRIAAAFAPSTPKTETALVPARAPEVPIVPAPTSPERWVRHAVGKRGRRELAEDIASKTNGGKDLVDFLLSEVRNDLLPSKDRQRAAQILLDRMVGRAVSVTGKVTHEHSGSVQHGGVVAHVGVTDPHAELLGRLPVEVLRALDLVQDAIEVTPVGPDEPVRLEVSPGDPPMEGPGGDSPT